MKKSLIILDNGHGGIINGKYVTAGKRSPVWSDGSQLFEGVFNRQIVDGIAAELDKLNINFDLLVPDDKDVPLRERVRRANYADNGKSLLISVHSNAGGGEGVEIFTSPGETKSDKIATVFGEEFKRTFPDKKLRTDYRDGDLDKEAKFTIIYKTRMPAILTENFFMDNEAECKDILMTDYGRRAIVQYHVNAIKRAIEENLI
ncbi:MAG: N-acetylmuramoyl-L-alanine amidase [Bacteroidales bacterium]|nr:N-acetylmuramoyl-L-alanine amidase [Bacteroidales bacterium]